jgi:hypothetical protein
VYSFKGDDVLVERGSIWTVPAAGDRALALILSAPRGVSRGRPEYQVVPLYEPSLLSTQRDHDFRLAPSETTLGVEYFAALWNARPLLEADLGRHVGQVRSREAMADLRNAYLRLADPSITVAPGRLGRERHSDGVEPWREQEIAAWQRLTGRALAPVGISPLRVRCMVDQTWTMFTFEQLTELTPAMRRSDSLANLVNDAAVGANTVFFAIDVALGRRELAPSSVEQSVAFPYFARSEAIACDANWEGGIFRDTAEIAGAGAAA